MGERHHDRLEGRALILRGGGDRLWTVLILVAAGTLASGPSRRHFGPSIKPNSRSQTALAAISDPSGYVGSKACAPCHAGIYAKYSQTDMGRSMSEITPALLEQLQSSASVFDERLKRHFEVYKREGKLFQTEYGGEREEGHEARETHEVGWIIGSGANGFGTIARRGDFLFEAPLSYYTKTREWALSPGYEFGDYGFNRPILAGCISCHSGQPRPVLNRNGQFLNPPFSELAIGCENCHGPGEAHVREMREGDSEGGASHSIVNPAKLSSWLADNICMSCHQTGDAIVLKPGKTYRDFRPGTPLDETLTILMVPPRPDSPQTDLLEHYFSMKLSKCYQKSGGRLSCITCHDPHVETGQQESATYYRAKCLGCHLEKSCALPLRVRERKTPPDDCAGCHMPKRNVQVIAHTVLTNHRIVAQAEEPYPDAAFHMTTPQMPDLVHINAIPGKEANAPSPLILLQAYRELMTPYPGYRKSYFALAEQLKTSEVSNVDVLEALADLSLERKDEEGALRCLTSAVEHGTTSPQTFEQLARLLIGAGRASEAAAVLERAIKLIPYDVALYRLLGSSYLSLQRGEAVPFLQQAVRLFPLDSALRDLLQKAEEEPRAGKSFQ